MGESANAELHTLTIILHELHCIMIGCCRCSNPTAILPGALIHLNRSNHQIEIEFNCEKQSALVLAVGHLLGYVVAWGASLNVSLCLVL